MERGDVRHRWRRLACGLAASPHAPVVAALLMALLAVAESLAHAGSAPMTGYSVSVPAPGQTGSGGPPPDGLPPEPGGGQALAFLGYALLALATTLPAGLLWAQPLAGAALVTTATVVSLAAFQTLTIAGAVTQLVVAHRLGRAGPVRGRPWATVVAAGAPFPLLALAGQADGEARVLTLALAALVPAALAAGVVRHATRVTAAHEVMAGTLLEHTARGERARIARELHDVVAHHISMVSVQAETARLTTPGLPAAGAERLTAIGDTARAALTEMRRLLGVLREDSGPGAQEERRPQPGLRLGELNELLDEARDVAGTATRLVLTGPPVPLDPGVELAAYRIVQEALTNARRHAPGAAVDVELHYSGDALRLRVRDNGPGTPAPPPDRPDRTGGGHGLAGMRERAAAVGGELRAGPAPDGGFVVEATLPGAAA